MPATTTPFFEITTNDLLGMVGWAKEIIGNAMPLILIILGIGVGIFIIRTIARLF